MNNALILVQPFGAVKAGPSEVVIFTTMGQCMSYHGGYWGSTAVLSNGGALSPDINMDTLTLFNIPVVLKPPWARGCRDYGVSDPVQHLVIPNEVK